MKDCILTNNPRVMDVVMQWGGADTQRNKEYYGGISKGGSGKSTCSCRLMQPYSLLRVCKKLSLIKIKQLIGFVGKYRIDPQRLH
jgi:hypothetical protein